MSIRDQILESDDLKQETVEIHSWGISVRVRSLRAIEREEMYLRIEEDKALGKPQNFNARLVAATVVDENGTRVFKDEDHTAIALKNAEAVEKIAEVALRLSGIGQDKVEKYQKN